MDFFSLQGRGGSLYGLYKRLTITPQSGKRPIKAYAGFIQCFLRYLDSNNTANNGTYHYVKNLQGDIIAIMDANGSIVVEYTYDAWGKLLTTTGTLASTIGALNPLRYRGYYYDTETGFYYLQSRYYDPSTCRMLNADEPFALQLSHENILGTNLYTYANNGPLMNVDPTGYFSVPAWTVSVPIDAAILWIAGTFQITWLGYMAPLKFMGKTIAAAYFARNIAPILSNLTGTIINVAVKALTWIGKASFAAAFNISAKMAISCIIFESMRAVTALTSVGGLIAAIWDYFSDRKFDGWIKLW